ncbi:oligomeric complex COG6-domain-containing protein [Stachybotrys elegans]|uniref:Conserved oligomeric Golgi complex subunit 6 n=1 Tax=Stachybotrys elegans TaxID=80388 RepID=A0A8K0SYH1_9HYPO|nr:oligomeric complex COG6-domain-containing protein [Stachybotrys elegans]
MSSNPSLSLKDLPIRNGSPLGAPALQSPGLSSASKNANPLTSKVTAVLSTSYSDTEFRNAIALLDERGIKNDAKTRRQIRLDLQKEVIDSNGEVISEFGLVAEQLQRIGATLGKLNAGFKDMKNRLSDAHGKTASSLSDAASLLEQRQQIETKRELLNAFKDHFIMSDDEVAALTLTAEPVDDRFFAALSKARNISKDCEVLLGFENQTLGLELMEQTSKNINLGFQKLYKWIQREFKTLNLENPQLNPAIRRALRVLAERPSLFQNCLDFFAEARERILSDSFYVALTGTSSSGVEDPLTKPIDMTAHDPLRYVGDMLAWLHSATVSEREALEVLFVAEGEELARGLKSGRDAEVWRLVADEDDEQVEFNALRALHDLVDRDVSGAARVMRQRVEQVIQSNEDIIPAYKLSNLINFYRVTFHKLLGNTSNLVECIQGLETEGLRQFRSLVRDHIAALQGEFQQTPSNLGQPVFLEECLKQLEAIAKTYDSSLSASDDRESEFAEIMVEAFEPFMLGCENMAKSMQSPSSSIFLINCWLSAANCLANFDFTKNRAGQLRERVDEQAKKLVESQHAFFIVESGLGPLFKQTRAISEGLPSLDKDALATASQNLDDFLPSALMDAMERLKHLQDPKLARQVTEEAAEDFCDQFELLEGIIEKCDDVMGSLRAVFPRTTAEIRTDKKRKGSYYAPVASVMLRNNALTALQKTYDDSYLSCSTAVYYETLGDEVEAMRHWRNALDLILEHHATRTRAAYNPQSDTEKALQDAVKQLELQCKERIDLLQALRASRQDIPTVSSPEKPGAASSAVDATRNSIGQGTIPAVTYSELSRPSLPHRPSLPNRASSEGAVVGGSSLTPEATSAPDMGSTPSLPPRPISKNRSASPEKQHTMRTTLRSGKPGEKHGKLSRKPAKPVSEGPSKAATLAWGALGSRDRHAEDSQTSLASSSMPTPKGRSSMEYTRKSGSSPLQWDRHTRRLVPKREGDNGSSSSRPSSSVRHSDEYPSARPSLLSQDLSPIDQSVAKSDRQPTPRSASILPTPPRGSRKDPVADGAVSNESGPASERQSASDASVRRRPVRRRSAGESDIKKPVSRTNDRSRPHERQRRRKASVSSSSANESSEDTSKYRSSRGREEAVPTDAEGGSSQESPDEETKSQDAEWKRKQAAVLKNLPAGVDEAAAKQILNDIVVHGDEVRWNDIAGLDIAKNALRETVVYPFLRPDLFMGLREPARGMLLFGPPGTGKTMLARAVATESKSTFFSISASSLTSKYLGESEKLVRALFGLARVLAPSIIFVDEIDSLLSQRSGSGEHEATRRIKTEFLIQWSDLQRAAAGRETTERDRVRGDANRVLVLAATNLPWAIDEAARRRFVRRQYIPLPEPSTRETQIRTLLGQQKHGLSDSDITRLVELTDGFSGSDITALAKDAAMGPLRSLGEALLHMTMDDIRPIGMVDFEASLGTIRPSVSKSGLKEYEDWAKEFGERGG